MLFSTAFTTSSGEEVRYLLKKELLKISGTTVWHTLTIPVNSFHRIDIKGESLRKEILKNEYKFTYFK